MKLQKIIDELLKAKEEGFHGFVEVTIPGQTETEFIVNKPQSIENKIDYYKKTYDENAIHKHCEEIRIVDAGAFGWDTTESEGK